MPREKAIEMLQRIRNPEAWEPQLSEDAKMALDMAIKALEQEPKTGKWIKYGTPRCDEQHYQCTNCEDYINFGQYGEYYKRDFKYCPHCGARMDGE